MADEPRRSGRATKGQHTKNQADASPPSKRGKGKGKKAKEVEQEKEEEEEGEEIIRCVCGDQEAIEGLSDNPSMICCATCNAWQHNICMGISTFEEDLPEEYYCEQCRPEEHKALLAAIERGEKPWEQAIADAIAEKNAGKKKGGRKSKGGRPSAAAAVVVEPSPTPKAAAVIENLAPPPPPPVNRRKSSGQQQIVPPQESVAETVPEPTKGQRRKSSAPSEEPSLKRRQSSIKSGDENAAKRRKSTITQANTVDELPLDRQKTSKLLARHIQNLLDDSQRDGSFALPAESGNADSFSTQLALQLEYALSSGHANPADQIRTILFNTKKNKDLRYRFLNGEISAERLATMTSEEMATEELQQERAVMKEEADKQAILLHEEGPRVRKTHKGDEIVGAYDAQEKAVDPINTSGTHTSAAGHPPAEAGPAMSPLTAHPDGASDHLGQDGRKSSAAFDISNVFNSVKSPTNAQGTFPLKQHRPMSLPQRQPSGSAPPAPKDPGEDPDIDRLLEDEVDADGNDIQWTGTIYMKKGATSLQCLGKAAQYGGANVNDISPWRHALPSKLEINGRIPIERADTYISDHKGSKRKVVSVLKFQPDPKNTPEQLEEIANYFISMGRWGVINGERDPAVVDLYFVPVRGSQGRPNFFAEIENIKFAAEEGQTQFFLVSVVQTSQATPPGPLTPQMADAHSQQAPNASQVDGVSHANGNGNAKLDPGYNPPGAAVRILGPFINEPVAKQMVLVASITDQHLMNLRDAFEKEPRTRTDLGFLMQFLKARAATAEQQAGGDVVMTG